MNSWQQYVGEHFGQSDGAKQFIKDVKGHIARYHAMRAADKTHPDSKDTFENLLEIRGQAFELGMKLLESHRQVVSYIEQGMFLANTPKRLVDVEAIGKELVYISRAIDAVTAEIGDDADVKRRGYHKHTPRNLLVKSVCESYSDRLNEFPAANDPRFAAILEAMLNDLGLPYSNLHRVLSESVPPAPDTH